MPPVALHLLASELREQFGSSAHPSPQPPRYEAAAAPLESAQQQQLPKAAMPQCTVPDSEAAAAMPAGPGTPSAPQGGRQRRALCEPEMPTVIVPHYL